MDVLRILLLTSLILLPICWLKSAKFRFVLKITFFYFSVSFAALITVITVKPNLNRDPDTYRESYTFWFGLMTSWLKIKWEVRNIERLEMDEPCIIICNHQSALDLHPLYFIWPPRALPLSKLSLIFNPLGFMLWLSGAPFIDRYNPQKARYTMNTCVQNVEDKRMKLIVFPEGTRNRSLESMLPFKKGGFHVAVQGKVRSLFNEMIRMIYAFKIVPVVFSSFKNFYDATKWKFITEGYGIIQVLQSISTDELNGEHVTQLSEDVRNSMIETFDSISREIEQKL